MEKIAILGEGVTGKAVQETCDRLGIPVVSVEEADLIVASPGIPPSEYPQVRAEVISEIEYAYRLAQARAELPYIIGVTGTNGKTTVTSLIAHICEIPACGNLGLPFISFVGQMPPALVIELSSYQLESCVDFRPDIGILLNLTPDHLVRHETMEEYMKAKARLVRHCRERDLIIYDGSSSLINNALEESPSQKRDLVSFSDDFPISHDHLVGTHNQYNMAASYLAAEHMGKLPDHILERIKTFKGLEHRLEKVGVLEERLMINDSKSTNPDSTIKAVHSFSKPIHLLLCGADKELEFTPFLEEVLPDLESIVVFGEIAKRMEEDIVILEPEFKVSRTETMTEAIDRAMENSHPGDIILLSPSSSSFDQFDSFEHRGNTFKELVLKKGATPIEGPENEDPEND